MADRDERVLDVSAESESETEVPEKDTMNGQVLEMWKLQHKSNTQFQQQMMQVLSAMAAQNTSVLSAATSAQTSSAAIPDAVSSASAQIRLASFDPDDTPFTMLEWMDDVTRIQQEIGISDTLIVLKAGDALRGRAARFYKHWKPAVRDWPSFRRDFEVAFPEQGTPATRIRECLKIKSSDFASLVEYGHAKLSAIKRFYSGFPWEITLSLLEYDVQDVDVKNRIFLQAPAGESDLLKLLAACDARHSIDRDYQPSYNRARSSFGLRKRRYSSPPRYSRAELSPFPGKCRKCDEYGHKQSQCTQINRTTSDRTVASVASMKPKTGEPKQTSNPKVCSFCIKIGHTEDMCYRKHGVQKCV